jgi:heterodisulfide reductase subunit D
MAVKKLKPLEEYRSTAWNCIRCGGCKSVYPWYMRSWKFSYVCPSWQRYRFDAYSGQGRMDIARAIIDGDLDITDKVVDIVYRCTTCGACEANCLRLQEHEPLEVIEALRAKVVEVGKGPMPQHKRFAESIEKNHNPYLESHEERLRWMPEGVKSAEKADVAYFVGCTSAYRVPEIAQATVKILQTAGIDFVTLHPEEWCCGSPLIRTGQLGLAKKVIDHNIKAIRDSGVRRVVVSCAGCYRTLKTDYPKFSGDLPFEILHMTELLSEQVKAGKIKFKEQPREIVTYHDPCHMGRHVSSHMPDPRDPVYEPPREILKAIPKIEFVEMERNRTQAWCCGAGGGVKSAFPDFALWAAEQRLEEAEATGATTLISSCPFCKLNLRDAIKERKSPIKMFDITEIALRAMV